MDIKTIPTCLHIEVSVSQHNCTNLHALMMTNLPFWYHRDNATICPFFKTPLLWRTTKLHTHPSWWWEIKVYNCWHCKSVFCGTLDALWPHLRICEIINCHVSHILHEKSNWLKYWCNVLQQSYQSSDQRLVCHWQLLICTTAMADLYSLTELKPVVHCNKRNKLVESHVQSWLIIIQHDKALP